MIKYIILKEVYIAGSFAVAAVSVVTRNVLPNTIVAENLTKIIQENVS